MKPAPAENIIVFDGYCHLCSGVVQFILKRDRHKRFRFAPLQGAYGQQQLQRHQLSPAPFGSFILVQGEEVFTRSTGALRVAKGLPGLWPLCYYIGMPIPSLLRDKIYDWVARHRYAWFGKHTQCWVPRPEWKERFID